MLGYIRFVLWAVLLFFAILLLGLSAGFIARVDDLGGSSDSAAVLLVFSILVFLLGPLYAFAAFAKRAFSLATAVFVELGVIVVLWLLVLGGSAGLSDDFADVDCDGVVFRGFDRDNSWKQTCQVGKATIAFGWLSWITMTALLGLMVFAVVKTRDFQGQTHEVMEGSSGGLGRKTPASPAVHMTQQA